jgi:glycerophosphoryl diester phosphodiesterase
MCCTCPNLPSNGSRADLVLLARGTARIDRASNTTRAAIEDYARGSMIEARKRAAVRSGSRGSLFRLPAALLQTSREPRAPAPAWLTSRPIAHRGLHDALAPENTLPAFEAAVAAGYPIELDVHVLRDGEVIVFHDADLLRAAGVARGLIEEDRASIRAYRLFGGAFGIPTLREVLALVQGKVPVLIEIKAERGTHGAARAVFERLVGYPGPLAVQSFDPWTVAWFRDHAPHIPRGQLAGPLRDEALGGFERFASRRLLTLALSRPHFVNFDLRALPDAWLGWVTRLAGVAVLCWTVRDASDLSKARALGLNFVFDDVRP